MLYNNKQLLEAVQPAFYVNAMFETFLCIWKTIWMAYIINLISETKIYVTKLFLLQPIMLLPSNIFKLD